MQKVNSSKKSTVKVNPKSKSTQVNGMVNVLSTMTSSDDVAVTSANDVAVTTSLWLTSAKGTWRVGARDGA